MTSFEFADCPTSVTLMASKREGKPVQTHDVLFSLRNRTARSISARTSVQADSITKAEWFLIDGAAPATPGQRDLHIEPNTTTGVKVTIAVPPDAPAGKHLFRVRVAAEDDPDDDFADSPAVAFATVEPPAPVKPARRLRRWWLVVVAGALVLSAAGAASWWVIRHRGPANVRGELGDAASKQLTGAGYVVSAVNGATTGKPRNTVIDQVDDPDGKHVRLILDPGTPKDVRGELLEQARKDLGGYAVETTYGNPAGKARDTVIDQSYDAGRAGVTLQLDPGPPSQPMRLVNRSSSLCMDVYRSNMADGTAVIQWTCTGGANQAWIYDDFSGTIRSMNDSHYCLDNSGTYGNGAKMIIWTCTANNNNQRFKYDASTGTVAVRSYPTEVIDMNGTSQGNQLLTATASGSATQSWTLTK